MTSTPKPLTEIKHLKVASWSKSVGDERFFDDRWHVHVQAGNGVVELELLRFKQHADDTIRCAHIIVKPREMVRIVAALQEALRYEQVEGAS